MISSSVLVEGNNNNAAELPAMLQLLFVGCHLAERTHCERQANIYNLHVSLHIWVYLFECVHVFACINVWMLSECMCICTNIGHTNVYEIYYCPAVRHIIHFKINLSQFVCCSVTNEPKRVQLCRGKWKTPHNFNTITTQYTDMAITTTTKQCNKVFTWIHNNNNINNALVPSNK